MNPEVHFSVEAIARPDIEAGTPRTRARDLDLGPGRGRGSSTSWAASREPIGGPLVLGLLFGLAVGGVTLALYLSRKPKEASPVSRWLEHTDSLP